MPKTVLRFSSIALLLLLVILALFAVRTAQRLPNSIIYFVKSHDNAFTLEPVIRKLPGNRQDKLKAIILALIAGPSAEEKARGLSTTFPPNLSLNRLELKGSELIVDLSTAFEEGGGTALMLGRLHQLFYSLSQDEKVSELSLFIDGVRVSAFAEEGILIANPWSRQGTSLPVW